MNVDGAQRGEPPLPDLRRLEERSVRLDERETDLRALHEAVAARSEAIEALLARREAALREREDSVWQREEAQRLVDLAMVELEKQNEELRQANARLVMATLAAQELKDAAQRAQRRQDEFVAMLSHELRNPLAAISAAVELLSRLSGKPIPPKLPDVARRQIRQLVRMVDDLLDVSRVNEGKIVLHRRTTAVTEFVQQAVETCRHAIDARRQRLSVDLGTTPSFVDGDLVRLTQIVCNLLQNAHKYTPEEGEIGIVVRREDRWVRISIRDTGHGISAAALPHVFDLFMQDERHLSRVQGGLGIGLTIVRRLVEMHGGSVEARSAGRDQGSEFTVRLPAVEQAATSPAQHEAVAEPAPVPARVLIIEDNVDAAAMLANLLQLSGHEVDIAADGPSGLERFERIRPQVVLCDIGLPGMDGYEVASRIRGLHHDPRPALIALTGYGAVADTDRALMSGFDHHVVKPVDPKALLRIINTAMRAEDRTTTETGVITAHGSLQDDDGPDDPH